MDKTKFLPFDEPKKTTFREENKMEAAKEIAKLVNGINTEQLLSTIDLIKKIRILPSLSFEQPTNGSTEPIAEEQSKISTVP